MASAAANGIRAAIGVVSGPFVRFGKAYAAAAEKRPFAVGVLTTGIKTSAADLFAQMVMERKQWHEIDAKRHFTFCLFGFTYLGAFQYFFYTKVLVWATNPITRTMGHIASAPAKTFVDQAIHHPFMYFPTFYLMKYSLVGGDSVDVALDRYQDELWTNCSALWKLWVPCQLVNFSVVPIHLQVPYVAAVSFVWTVILSVMRGSDTSDNTNDAKATDLDTDTTNLAVAAAGEGRGFGAAAPEAPLTAATGVPIGGILAVASQSSESTSLPLTTPHAPTSQSTDPPITPHHTSALPPLPHPHPTHHSTPQAPLDRPSAIAAAASISEHSPTPSAAPAAAASVAEPLLLPPRRNRGSSAHTCGRYTSAKSAESHAGRSQGTPLAAAAAAASRPSSAPYATSAAFPVAWGGAAALLHLQHPILG